MSAKKPSAATQLKTAAADVARLAKELDSAKQQQSWSHTRATDAERELADVHAFLNAVPNPPSDKHGEYGAKLSAITRLSVFLATR